MKKIIILLSVALAALAVSCNKVTPQDSTPDAPKGETITITVSLSDALTKVSLTQDSEDADGSIKLAWEEDDVITVIDAEDDTNSAVFEVDQILEDPCTATFTGTAPSGATSFNILYGAPNVTAANNYNSEQSQTGNASTAHLQYMALISGVTSIENIEFSKTWAEANGGSFSQNGALRFRIQVPDDITSVASVSLNAPSAIFSGSQTIKVSFAEPVEPADGIITAYAMLPMGEAIEVSEGDFEVTIETADENEYCKTFSPGAISFKPGQTNAIKLNKSGFSNNLFAGGAGVEGDSYLIATAKHLQNMHIVMKDNAVIYFKMIDDINLEGIDWVSLNNSGSFSKGINFDGDNHTISHLNHSFLYVLKGSVHDLILDSFSITDRGALAEYIQVSGNIVSKVTISNGTVSSAQSNTGGLIGTINKGANANVVTATITDCTVSSTNVSGTGVIGGLVGFADAKVEISGCSYTDGTVSATARYCGGLLGSTGNYDSVITNCHVQKSTISSTATEDVRCGGFCGQVQTKVQIKGCSVGTESQRVIVKLGTPATDKVLNAGGFAGTSYGTITKNGDARCKAYVKISSSNTSSANVLNLGGFAGYHQGTIEYSDVDADITGQKGQYIGGFIGRNVTSGVVRFCTSNASVNGDNYTGGFVGNIISGGSPSYEGNIAAGSVSAGATVGGFAGNIASGTITKCSTSCTVSGTTNIGGFAGQINGAAIVSRCSSSGTTTASGNVCGGFAGVASNGASISDSFSTCDLSGTNRKRGGLVALFDAGTLSVSRCYATGSISNNFETGGLIGFANVEGLTMTNSAAWNDSITASSIGAANWSTGAIVGVTYLTSTLTNNYRSPDMKLTAYWGNYGGYTIELTNKFQHPDVSPSAPLTDINGNAVSHANNRPYHGKCDADKTLSQLASTTLGWSSDVWDFSGSLPTLK
ncbi:MAG: hypothetical protein J6Y45_00055 [Bacteroidales bacterium]|nr:hypothetical protein [Bacteroidales bacterium]